MKTLWTFRNKPTAHLLAVSQTGYEHVEFAPFAFLMTSLCFPSHHVKTRPRRVNYQNLLYSLSLSDIRWLWANGACISLKVLGNISSAIDHNNYWGALLANPMPVNESESLQRVLRYRRTQLIWCNIIFSRRWVVKFRPSGETDVLTVVLFLPLPDLLCKLCQWGVATNSNAESHIFRC